MLVKGVIIFALAVALFLVRWAATIPRKARDITQFLPEGAATLRMTCANCAPTRTLIQDEAGWCCPNCGDRYK